MPAPLHQRNNQHIAGYGNRSCRCVEPHKLRQAVPPLMRSAAIRPGEFLLIQLIYLTFYVLSLARLPEVRLVLGEAGEHARLILVPLIITAAAGIPTRLYLLTAAAFNYRGLGANFRKLFPFLLPLDALWALAPFLAAQQLGFGLALAVTAALLYLPFAQRSLLLMRDKSRTPAKASPGF